ncbi:hypothetical protein BG003_002717 [Podila horticola]|nr:hypothetical protein BG003_002717 [Podila horticola]
MVAEHAHSSGSKPKKRNEKYFSDDARVKLLAAFANNNYPDNDVKDQLAAELDLTPIQVKSIWKAFLEAQRSSDRAIHSQELSLDPSTGI